jgi:hypothetical protein
MNNQFNERFVTDEVEEGGSGSFVLKADSVADRFESQKQRNKTEIDGLRPKRIYTSMTQLYGKPDMSDDDAVGLALEAGDYKHAGEMVNSIRIIKHEEGNPECQHCS